ncbi:MAG: ABC transporter substrate-binding protein [Culicoidibacterales bacterium]
MKKLFSMVGTMMLAVTLVACGSSTSEEATTVEMRVVQDVKGNVEIPVDPQRIADLSGASDTLSLLGFDVVGTANSDGYDYTKLPTYLEDELAGAEILGYSYQDTMDIEAVFALEPDLIIISTMQEKMYEQLSAVAPTVMIELTQMDWRADLLNVATVMDRVEVAQAWLAEYDAKAAEVGAAIKAANGEDTTYLAFLASAGSHFVFDGAGLGSVLYEDLDLAKPVGMPKQVDVSLPVVSYEGLAAIEADEILAIGTDEDLAELLANPIWQNISAVQAGNVVELAASPYFNIGYSPIGRLDFMNEIENLLSANNE